MVSQSYKVSFVSQWPDQIQLHIICTSRANNCWILTPTLINTNNEGVQITRALFLTLIDAKVTHVLTRTLLSSTCNMCGAKPTEMNNMEKVTFKHVNESAYLYGLSTLHCWIRFMVLVLHILYNLRFAKWMVC